MLFRQTLRNEAAAFFRNLKYKVVYLRISHEMSSSECDGV